MLGETPYLKRRFMLALALIGATLMLVWWNPTGFWRPFQALLATVVLPIQSVTAWGAFELSETREFFQSLSTLKTDQARLEKENLRLRAEVARLSALGTENEHLRALLALTEETEGNVVMGEVLSRDGSGLAQSLTINRGTAQGVRPGMAVVGEGKVLVGRILSAEIGTATVVLLPHPEFMTSAALASSLNQGIVRGDHGLGVVFDLALRDEAFEVGEAVVTAGLGDTLPRGLLIGTIESVRPSADRLFQQAVIVSPLRFENLRVVGVIIE